LTAQLAQLYTGGRVIGIDPIKQRRRIAEKVGIKTLDPDTDDIIQSVKEITGNGADIVIEASGSQHALDKAMEITTYRGKIAVVGGHYGKREIDLKTNFQNKELSIIGARRIDKFTEESLYDKWPPKKYNNLILELIKNGDISIEPLISHEIKPEDAQDIYKRLIKKDPDVFGAVFDWTQSTTI